ncbi:hypothetical protein LTR56_024116 [Elasticomyces elasticus]|nr:hypothetical protein LTR56_024116 [Elasticomyces elasticus]KAK3623853.1 hypothetical protein LTR22_024214 [Elasticomyces elasticus]KAK4914999.1 hypothetical protein LTR49_016864 [Elasticomyces elasticus]KAK5746051.1 hypothetical protein LTS12_022909 [Elasticomyces elasticus]
MWHEPRIVPSALRTSVTPSALQTCYITSNQSAVMAAQAVFAVPGLLEMILLQLPMEDMQRSRAVCKTGKREVDFSVPIKKALFLLPGMPADLAHDTRTYEKACKESKSAQKYGYHPLFVDENDPDENDICLKHILRHGEQSLRQALVTQPPTMASLTAIVIFPCSGIRPFTIELDAGETFGSLCTKITAEGTASVYDPCTEVVWYWRENRARLWHRRS